MKKNKLLIVALVGICLSILLYFFSTSYAVSLDNDVRVKENSDLTYYLDIGYDGKDKNVVMSSDTATAEVRSDYIYVEDKIPDGLVFKEFVNSSDGSIGAVEKGDSSRSCSGSVVGGYDGLKYDADTRMVSFTVKDLQAGCKLTVGIVTTTPSLGTKSRMDFFNTAFAREGSFSANSNTVHVFMGEENSTLHNVTYQYTGDVPENAPELPSGMSYVSGSSVGVLNNVVMDGYSFSGWSTNDVSISNNSFVMPSNDVVFTGSFTKKETRVVSYSIAGDVPEGYSVPRNRIYGIGDGVVIDSLKVGDEINGYRFLGWTSDAVNISDDVFTMPDQDVTLVGKFERIGYKVTYQFQGVNIPENADSLLPEEATYYPGDTVTVADYPTALGYRFLGWYQTKTFKMPTNDVVIYGEWMIENGVFVPTIKKEIENIKDFYLVGDTIQFKITVTNTANFEIKDVLLEEHLEDCNFQEGTGYELLNNQYVKIASIPANGSIEVRANYIVKEDLTTADYINEVELTGAIADNYYYLDTTKDYKATAKFKAGSITLNINKVNEKQDSLSGAEFTLYKNKELTEELQKGLSLTGLLPNNIYYLKETKAPDGYQLLPEILEIKVDSTGKVSTENYQVENKNGVATITVINTKENASSWISSIVPNTYDAIMIYVIMFIVSLVVLVILVYFLIKKRKVRYKKNDDHKEEIEII